MKPFLSLFLGFLLPGTLCAQLEWRISVKLFTGPNGELPTDPGWGGGNIRQSISNNIAMVNRTLYATGRGYQWRLTEIVTVAGNTTPLPASTNSWFNLPVNAATQDDLDGKAKANAAAFAYRTDAINFYFVNSTVGPNGGYCAFPNENQHVITVAPNSFSDVLIHEAGHFFSLAHTFDSGGACNMGVPQSLGDDGIADTARDYPCGTRDQLSQGLFGANYANLTAGQQAQVDSAWLNIMSYHSPGSLFTSDQLDRMTDSSNGDRFNVASGRTRFVDFRNSGIFQFGSSVFPFGSVGAGVNGANPGDIVLIRSGTYTAPQTITKAVTLRATRGWSTLVAP
ncbi:MAG TPA: M43 family zinc metalloprotease [Methylomirabilota bacterium]|nr:M43 family zinc metalloprotease [Methylomirabilota bacterium]